MLDGMKDELTSLGYYVAQYRNLESIGVTRKAPTEIKEIPGGKLYSFDCIIDALDGIRIEYNIANISDEIVFPNRSEAINWIKKEFPI